MKRRRVAKGIWVLLVVLALFFLGGDNFGTGDAITHIARSQLYSIARWEIGNLPKKWTHQLIELFRGGESQEQRVARVRRYFELNERINDLQSRVAQVRDGVASESNLSGVERELAGFRQERDALKSKVEETLEAMIASTLKKGGVSSKFLGLRLLWPPVDFRLDVVPNVLIVSPRDRIELLNTRLIDPQISPKERDALEGMVDGRGLSSLVEGLGGVATYPSHVPEGSTLLRALELAAHEWTHHYLFFHPLGRAYHRNENMTTMNETVADIVGEEIGRAIYCRHFATPEECAHLSEPDPPRRGDGAFDFNAFMRETRLTAERLLAEGKIEEAEAYMEERRKELGRHGYFFRKINQAFFAFHGTYADRPGAVSPIGGQLKQVRGQSPSLGEFLSRVARYSSYESFLRDLRQGG